MSNEIFYRVALALERWKARNPSKSTFPMGHFYVAWVQAKYIGDKLSPIDLSDKYTTYIDYTDKSKKESKRTIYIELSKLIRTVENTLFNSLSNFNDLF